METYVNMFLRRRRRQRYAWRQPTELLLYFEAS